MSDSRAILRFIKRVRLMRLLLHSFYSASTGALILLSSVIMNQMLKKIFYFKLPHEGKAYFAIFLFSFMIFFLIKFRYYFDILKNAIYIDNRFFLKDRFSSYIDGKRRGIPEEISRFQECAINKDILPGLEGKKIIDFKTHFSFKYILALCIILLLLPYAKDKKIEAFLISKEEKKVLDEQEDNIKEFIAYLKNEDLSKVLSEKNIKELADTFDNAAKKIKKGELDKKDAIKLLSKLVDKSKKMMKDVKSDLSVARTITEFDSGKMGTNSEFKDFLDSKKSDLKEKLDDIQDKNKDAKEKKKDIAQAEDILEVMEEKSEGMMPDMEGKKSGASLSETDIPKEDLEQLMSDIAKANSELNAEDKKLSFESKVDELNKDLEDTKKKLADNYSEKSNEELEYEEKENEIKVTFDSRIKNMQKGKTGTDKGPGTTNEDAGYATFDPQAPQKGEEIHDMTKAEFEKIYSPSRTDTEKDKLVVKGEMVEGDSVTLPGDKVVPQGTPVNTPYAKVYKDYRDVAQKAIDVQKVPRVYKEYVLDYFDSINPDLREE